MKKHFQCLNCHRMIKYNAKNGFVCGGRVIRIAYKNDFYRLCWKNDLLKERQSLDMNTFDIMTFLKTLMIFLIEKDIKDIKDKKEAR